MYDLEEKPVGAALDITHPAAVLKSSRGVAPPFSVRGVPLLLLNDACTRLAVFFKGAGIVHIFSLQIKGNDVVVEKEKEESGVSAFAWSSVSDKYATISDKLLFLHVSAIPETLTNSRSPRARASRCGSPPSRSPPTCSAAGCWA